MISQSRHRPGRLSRPSSLWDLASDLAVLRVPGLTVEPAPASGHARPSGGSSSPSDGRAIASLWL